MFFTFNTSFHVLSALVGSTSLVKCFLQRPFRRILTLELTFLSTCNFCNVFILLCLAPKQFTTYYIYISKYHLTLHQIRFIYYAYIGKVIGNMIFQHYDGSFDSSSNQFNVSLGGFGLLSMVQFVLPTFLGYWPPITLTFIICFQ
jgi:hypothetical protein